MEAIVFTAQGDMRQVRKMQRVLCNDCSVYCSVTQALNNLQSTYSGFGFVNAENVFKVSGGREDSLLDLIHVCEDM